MQGLSQMNEDAISRGSYHSRSESQDSKINIILITTQLLKILIIILQRTYLDPNLSTRSSASLQLNKTIFDRNRQFGQVFFQPCRIVS